MNYLALIGWRSVVVLLVVAAGLIILAVWFLPDLLVGMLGGLYTSTVENLQAIYDSLAPITDPIGAIFAGLFDGTVWNSITDSMYSFSESVYQTTTSIFTTTSEIISNSVTIITDPVGTFVGDVYNTTSEIVSNTIGIINNWWNSFWG